MELIGFYLIMLTTIFSIDFDSVYAYKYLIFLTLRNSKIFPKL